MGRLRNAFVVALAMMLAAPADADETVLATLTGDGVVMKDEGGEVALTVDLTRPVGWRLWLEDGPPRVVLELAEMKVADDPELRSTSVVSLEFLETGPDLCELQATLREPLSILSAEMVAAEDGTAQIVVLLKPTTAEAFQADLEAAAAMAAEPASRPVIAIDPGHGGRDPGAEAGDIREADLMLQFAERLRDVLVASGQLDVVLT
ncbi:MAG: N-acetylmuramoyl-L-alanine amidase, partial [Pseudomonadota bacterium]